MSKVNKVSFMKALGVVTTRSKDPQQAAAAEDAFAREVLGDPEILAVDQQVRKSSHDSNRELSPFGATEQFAGELQGALFRHATRMGTPLPKDAKYTPLFATPVIFKGLWQSRQMADQLSIPYGFYANTAVDYWASKGRKRMPLPSQLHAPDVALYVMAAWQSGQGSSDGKGPGNGAIANT